MGVCIMFGMQQSVREKDAELENLRKSLTELKERAERADPLLRLGSPEKLASLVTRNVRGLELEQVGLELRVCAN